MPAIKTKCVWDDIDRGDGLRILVSRYIPRGCPKKKYDVWMANLGPSERLLKDYLADRIPWVVLSRRYKTEQSGSGVAEKDNPRIRNCGQKFTLRLLKELSKIQQLTFLCNCASVEPCCHRHLLKALVESPRLRNGGASPGARGKSESRPGRAPT